MSIFDTNVTVINEDNLIKRGYIKIYGDNWFSKSIKHNLNKKIGSLFGNVIVRFEGRNISAFYYRPSMRSKKMVNTGLRYVTDMFEIIKMEEELQNYLNKL